MRIRIHVDSVEAEKKKSMDGVYYRVVGLDNNGHTWIPPEWVEEIPEPIAKGAPCLFWDDAIEEEEEAETLTVSRYMECTSGRAHPYLAWNQSRYRHCRPPHAGGLEGRRGMIQDGACK